MKKAIVGVVALLAGAFVAHSQGNVFFANYFSGTYIYVSLGNVKIGGTSSTTTGNPNVDTGNGSDWTVALYGNAGWNDPASVLKPVILDGTANVPVTATFAGGGVGPYLGTWYSTAVGDIPGTTLANQQATLQLFAWYNDGGRVGSYAAALADEFPTGFTMTANILTGGPQLNGPWLLPALPSFIDGGSFGGISFSAAPEPTTMSLCLVGTAAFFLRALRKLI